MRTCDHKINLKEDTNSICVRPYRYPAFQKNAINELIKEMLERGIIQPNNNPFSSPVVLVKKKKTIHGGSVLIIKH